MHLLDQKGLNNEIQKLIGNLDEDDQQQIEDYIQWIAEEQNDVAA